DFSKIEAGRIDLEQIDFNLRQLFDYVHNMFHDEAKQRGLMLTSEVDSSVPSVTRGDPIRLRQIITNLLHNAVNFTQSGTVRVRVTAESIDNERLLLRTSVSDTGIGISP